MGIDDELRNHLSEQGSKMTIRPADIEAVQARAAQRNRHARIGGAVASIALVVGAVVGYGALTGGEGNTETEIAVQPPESTTVAPTSTTTSEPVDATALVTSTGVAPPEGSSGIDVSQWLLPWGETFLYLEFQQSEGDTTLVTEVLTELAEYFSPEVVALFEDDPPATIEEATERLQDAGLYDEVADVVTANPEISNQIFGEPVPGTLVAWELDDDDRWTRVDITTPTEADQWISSVTSNGRHLIATMEVNSSEVPATKVLTTSDLQNWSVQDVPIPADEPLPDYVDRYTGVSSAVAGPEGWAAVVSTSGSVRFEDILPAGLLDPDSDGYGWGVNKDGVTVNQGSSANTTTTDGERSATTIEVIDDTEGTLVTWDELPISYEEYERIQESSDAIASAPYGGAVTLTENTGISTLAATDVGFLGIGVGLTGDEVRFSGDGISFAPIEPPALDGDTISTIGTLGHATLLFTNGGAAYAGTADARQWTTIDAPPGMNTNQRGVFNGVGFVDQAPRVQTEVEPIELEREGYRIVVSYEEIIVFEAATGGIVTTFAEDSDGVEVDEGTGEVRLSLPESDVVITLTQEDFPPLGQQLEDGADQEYLPQFHLVATADGTTWLDEPYGNNPSSWGSLPAINGTKVMVRTESGDWTRYELG